MSETLRSTSLFCLYGPSGAGKSTIGALLAKSLALPFTDLDREIEGREGRDIPAIFAEDGERRFRSLESKALSETIARGRGVIALGGGALLDSHSRVLAETAGMVLCLSAPLETLLARLRKQEITRPLIGNSDPYERFRDLLERRSAHYASFQQQMDTSGQTPVEAARKAQILLGAFHVNGMGSGYDVRVQAGNLDRLGAILSEIVPAARVALVTDETVGDLYAGRAAASLESCGYRVHRVVIPAGESHKTMQTIATLWESFLEAGLDRGSLVVALGGGVVSDLAGFAAATYLRGIRWAVVPTTLLSMADASLGGKTGVDLPQGKNLVGAFHPPALVLADPELLWSLPEAELRSGLGEVVKHGVLADEALLAQMEHGWDALTRGDRPDWSEIVRRAMAVKIHSIEADPFEKGERAALNLGHTIGHAVEKASGYRLRHGEAVAIGLALETRLAERIGLAQSGLAERIETALVALGLPTRIPDGMKFDDLRQWMQVDKKRAGGVVRFALPAAIGDVRTGIAAPWEDVWAVLEDIL